MVIPASNFMLPEEVLLEEAMRHLDCSWGTLVINQDGPSSVPMPKDSTNPTQQDQLALAPHEDALC